jgi:hypothetical protein
MTIRAGNNAVAADVKCSGVHDTALEHPVLVVRVEGLLQGQSRLGIASVAAMKVQFLGIESV